MVPHTQIFDFRSINIIKYLKYRSYQHYQHVFFLLLLIKNVSIMSENMFKSAGSHTYILLLVSLGKYNMKEKGKNVAYECKHKRYIVIFTPLHLFLMFGNFAASD